MTQPRKYVPDAYYVLTRRTVVGHPLFQPNPLINLHFHYLLAVYVLRHNIKVLGYCLLPDRETIVLHDPHRLISEFMRDLHREFGGAVKALRGWSEAVWDHRKPELTDLYTEKAVLEAMATTAALPIAEGYVRKSEDWPGPISLLDGTAKSGFTVKRPEGYSSVSGCWPESVSLSLGKPKNSSKHTAQGLPKQLKKFFRLAVKKARALAKTTGRKLLSKKALQEAPHLRTTPRTNSPVKAPRFAVGKGNEGMIPKILAAMRKFQKSYREAMGKWRRGDRSVVFPHGTYMMDVVHGANVASAA